MPVAATSGGRVRHRMSSVQPASGARTRGPAGAWEDFLSALEPEDVRAIVARATPHEFRAGQAICHQHQVLDRVLILRTGRVKVTATTCAGRDVVLAFRGPGDLVGELSALDDEPRSATIVTLEPVSALALTPADFRRLLTERAAIALALMRLLSRRLRDADTKRIEVATTPTIGRVAGRLLELCDRFGERDGDCVSITLPLSQEELAGWVGASVESVGRSLHIMRELGWIQTRRRGFRVLDADALRHAAT
jgi:CRP/FNR family cyclic AMP-dependent transcriptional regulator